MQHYGVGQKNYQRVNSAAKVIAERLIKEGKMRKTGGSTVFSGTAIFVCGLLLIYVYVTDLYNTLEVGAHKINVKCSPNPLFIIYRKLPTF